MNEKVPKKPRIPLKNSRLGLVIALVVACLCIGFTFYMLLTSSRSLY